MPLIACGINHQTASLALREQVVFTPELMPEPLWDLVEQARVSEAAILSTCNRTEIYCAGDDHVAIINWLHQHKQLPVGQLNPHLYFHHDQNVVRHILRVASGLDSMVLGEPQIFGQIKTAFSWAEAAGTLGTQLHHLFQYVFSVTKQVRTQTAISAHPLSMAYVAANLAKHIFADLSKLSVLLIGAGETIELTARHLRAIGMTRFCVANRTIARAEKLAHQLQGSAITLSAIPDYLPQADIVVTATASPLPILGKGTVERAIKIRKRRPMLMIDFAVPRDIESAVAKLDDIYLYTLDDVQALVQKNQHNRQDAAFRAEAIIDEQAAHYMHNLKVLEAVPVIRAYRDKAEKIRHTELLKATRLLQSGISAEEVLQRLAQSLTNKLLHAPTVQLREAAYQNKEELLLAARELFGLDADNN